MLPCRLAVAGDLLDTLRDWGCLTPAQSDWVEERQAVRGGAMDTAVLEVQGVGLDSVLEALRSVYPDFATADPADVRRTASMQALRVLPEPWCRKYRLAPLRVESASGRLWVMSPAPPDPVTLDRLSDLLEIQLVPVLAPELWVYERLRYLYDVPEEPRLATLLSSMPPSAAPPSNLASALDRVSSGPTRDEIVRSALDFAAPALAYVALFVVYDQRLHGFAARGSGASDIRELTFSLETPSVFRLAYDAGTPFVGALPDDVFHRSVLARLERGHPKACLLVPVQIQGRTRAMLYGDNGEAPIEPGVMSELALFMPNVGRALEQLIRQQKSGRPGASSDLPVPEALSDSAALSEGAALSDAPGTEDGATEALSRRAGPGNAEADPDDTVRTRAVAVREWEEDTPSEFHLRAEGTPAVADDFAGDPPTAPGRPSSLEAAAEDDTPKSAVALARVFDASEARTEPPRPSDVAADEAADFDVATPDVASWNGGAEAWDAPGLDFGPVPQASRPPFTGDLDEADVLPVPDAVSDASFEDVAEGQDLGASSRSSSVPPPAAPVRARVDDADTADIPKDERRAWVQAVADLSHPRENLRQRAYDFLAEGGADALPELMAAFPGAISTSPFEPGSMIPPLADASLLLSLLVRLGPVASPTVANELESSDPLRRFFATYFLEAFPSSEAVSRLVERLHDEKAVVCRMAVAALRAHERMPSYGVVQNHLGARLSHGPRPGLPHTIRLCGMLHQDTLVPQLIAHLEDRQDAVRQAARAALTEITKQDLGASPKKWRAWLEKHGRESRVAWLLEALRGRNIQLRRSAARELEAISGISPDFVADASRRQREKALRPWLDWWQSQRS